MQSKFQQVKQAIANPPPERLAMIEYRSHLYQALGITAVTVILIIKGFWYIIFAFIFGIGVSYSQGMTAWKKYKFIMSLKPKEDEVVYRLIPSFTRRRNKIIKSVYGNVHRATAVLSVALAIGIVPMTLSRVKLVSLYFLVISISYFFLHFYLTYWFAEPIYKEKFLKGGKTKNAKRKKEKS